MDKGDDMKTAKEQDRAMGQARALLSSVLEMVDAGEIDYDGDMLDAEAIQERINVRTDWYWPDAEDNNPTEYTILLCAGSPACRIIGDLSEYGEPETARIEYQDWLTPWVDYPIDNDEEEKVLTYCRQFYFGG